MTEVRAFLEDLAVRQRVGPSTQKQALNAVVFFLAGALGVELDDFSDFARASPRRRVPVVLSRVEVRALFGELEGTCKLIAEMAYGGGLRLIELLRLKVQDVDLDVDLERWQVVVRGGNPASGSSRGSGKERVVLIVGASLAKSGVGWCVGW